MKVFTAPETPDVHLSNYVSIYIGGGTTNCHDWQSELIEELNKYDLKKLVVFNPRRDNFDINNKTEFERQVKWEYKYLSSCDIFMMNFCNSDVTEPICLYELGRYITLMKQRYSDPNKLFDHLLINVDCRYSEALNVELQYNLATGFTVFKDADISELAFNIIQNYNNICKEKGIDNNSLQKKDVCIINGYGGVGKDSFVHAVAKLFPETGVHNVSSVGKIKAIAQELGWDGISKTEKDRKFLSDLKDLTSNYSDLSFKYMRSKVKTFFESDASVCFLHIREPEEIERARKAFNAITILVTNVNVEPVKGNHADELVNQYDYDYVVINNGTLEDLDMEAIKFVKKMNSQ